MKFTYRHNPIQTIFCLFIWTVPLFVSGLLHASQRSEKGKEERPNKQSVPLDSLSGMGGLKSVVLFTAKDSVIYNLDKRKMELWGKARIDHEDTSIKAPKIIVDLDTSLFRAFGIADSSKKLLEPAVYTDRQGSFNAETMTYNLKTKKGETTNISSSTKQVVFSGANVKRLENGEMFIKDGTFTSCEDPSPHWWVSSSEMTIIPDNRIIARPMILYVRPEIFSERLPSLPILALPYMVFPLKDGRSSGFLVPSFGHNSDMGYGLTNLGYFWAINDYMDLRLNSDISLNGSWGLGERFRYKESNVFSGEIAGEYLHYPAYSDWNAKIIHNQVFDSSTRLDVNVQLQGPPQGFDLYSNNSITMVTQQSNARAGLAKTFNNENGIASITYNRSEDLSTLVATQTIDALFYQNRMYPFRSSFPVDDWRSDVSLSSGASYSGSYTSPSTVMSSGYSANADVELGYYHEFSEGNKALFTQGVSLQGTQPMTGLYDAYNGTSVVFPLKMQSTLFRYFNVNPSLTVIHSFSQDSANRDFSTTVFAVDASTRLYGILETGFLENLFGLNALRHTFIPTLSYLWNPPFSGTAYNYYGNVYDWTDPQLFSRLGNTTYAGVPEGQNTVGISLKNLIQGKVRGPLKADEECAIFGEETVQLLSLNASTAYNFNADALHLAPVAFTASSNALSPNVLFSAGTMYDVYGYDPLTGNRVDRRNSEDGGGLLRFIKGFLNMSLSIQGNSDAKSSVLPWSSSPAPLFGSNIAQPNSAQSIFIERFNNEYFRSIDFRQPWEFQFSLLLQSDKSNPLAPVTTSLINGSVKESLSKQWQMVMNTGYDIQNNQLVFPMLRLNRDLDCWQMSFLLIPFGQFRSYAFQIGLKPPFSDFSIKTGTGASY